MWLVSAPQFWYGFIGCAALVLLALLPGALFPRRTVIVYDLSERAPAPAIDPFYKPGADKHLPRRTRTALREHREKIREERSSYDGRRPAQPPRITEARKRAV